jgi:ABC-type multidrug transport system permease subunit
LDKSGVGETAKSAPRNPRESRASHPLIELTLARLREFKREPEVVFWVFVFPVLLAFALGIAFRNTDPEPARIAVESSADAQAANNIAEILRRTPNTEPLVLSQTEAAAALRSGRVALVVRPASEGSYTYRFDATRPESREARLLTDDALQRAAGRQQSFTASEEKVSETGARYIDFLIPGLIGLNLMGSGMWGLGFAIVQARTRKLLKRLAATPMRRSDYLLSFLLSRLVFLFFEVAAVIGFAWLVFGVEVRGSLISLSLALLVGAAAFAGLGLLTAARPTSIEGVSGLMNAVMLPMWLFSGTFFASSRFPEFLQPLIQILPLTALNDALRAIMNDGATLASQWTEILILVVWSVVTFMLALKFFKWQ